MAKKTIWCTSLFLCSKQRQIPDTKAAVEKELGKLIDGENTGMAAYSEVTL